MSKRGASPGAPLSRLTVLDDLLAIGKQVS